MITPYGPGDPETWGAPTGHSLDPRTDDTDEYEDWEPVYDLDYDYIMEEE